MAINMKALFADALLDLCEHKPLRYISVTDLSKITGASKTTFYNHFQDKNDLIHYIYSKRILRSWEDSLQSHSELAIRTEFYACMLPYKRFLMQAFQIEGQNSLADFAYEFCVSWYEKQLAKRLGPDKQIPSDLHFSCHFVSYGIVYSFIEWINNGMSETPEKLAANIAVSMPARLKSVLFSQSETDSC